MTLSFSIGNGKLDRQTAIFSLPAGHTCPGALDCLSMAVKTDDGVRIVDGPQTKFRCFAASSEALFPKVFITRARNLETIKFALKEGGPTYAGICIQQALSEQITRKVTKVRIHESGDFFSQAYLQAWLDVADRMPELDFYCYSKNLPLFLGMEAYTPQNFYLTASMGGKFDRYIQEGHFKRYSVVVKTEEEAMALGLEVDHDDSHCFGEKPFALLVHGVQPKGSEWGKAIRARRKEGKHAGYNKQK